MFTSTTVSRVLKVLVPSLTSYNKAADAYIRILDAALRDTEGIGHGRDGIYFLESGEYELWELAKAISEALVALGVAKSVEPSGLTAKELEAFPPVSVLWFKNILPLTRKL